MLQQSGQIPLGMFDTNPHQDVPGSFAAGQSRCIAYVRLQDQIIRPSVIPGEKSCRSSIKTVRANIPSRCC